MKATLLQNETLMGVLKMLYQSRLPGSITKKVMYLVLSYDEAKDALSADIKTLQNKYGEKNDKGELVSEDGRVVFTPEKRKQFDDEYLALMDKNYGIGLLSQNDVDKIPGITGEEMKVLLDAGLISAS